MFKKAHDVTVMNPKLNTYSYIAYMDSFLPSSL